MSRIGTGQVGERVSSPVRLANHVSRRGGRNVNELLREAEHAIEALSEEFRELAKADIAQLRNARDGQSVQKIFEISHELRGLAGSFDLPMLTQVGTSLCDFVAQLESSNALCQEVVDLHIATMFQIVTNNMTGSPDQTGQQLLKGLLEARAKAEKTLGSPPMRADRTADQPADG